MGIQTSTIWIVASFSNTAAGVNPRLYLHVGVGIQHFMNPDSSPASVLHFDAVGKLGLTGGAVNGFPQIAGLSSSTSSTARK